MPTFTTETKYTTVALNSNQYLMTRRSFAEPTELYCEGYTNGKRDKSLDGYYFAADLKIKL